MRTFAHTGVALARGVASKPSEFWTSTCKRSAHESECSAETLRSIGCEFFASPSRCRGVLKRAIVFDHDVIAIEIDLSEAVRMPAVSASCAVVHVFAESSRLVLKDCEERG